MGDELEPPYERTGLGVTKGFVASGPTPPLGPAAPQASLNTREKRKKNPGKIQEKVQEKLPGEGLEQQQQQRGTNASDGEKHSV